MCRGRRPRRDRRPRRAAPRRQGAASRPPWRAATGCTVRCAPLRCRGWVRSRAQVAQDTCARFGPRSHSELRSGGELFRLRGRIDSPGYAVRSQRVARATGHGEPGFSLNAWCDGGVGLVADGACDAASEQTPGTLFCTILRQAARRLAPKSLLPWAPGGSVVAGVFECRPWVSLHPRPQLLLYD